MGEAEGLVAAELVAVIAAVVDGEPLVLTTDGGRLLPSGPLQSEHRSMQAGMRSWVERRTGDQLGYVEQLYTFADRDRGVSPVLEVSYLGLTTVADLRPAWRSWYDYFPWEDRRDGADLVADVLGPALMGWVDAGDPDLRARRHQRCQVTFGLGEYPWLPGMALQRYELLYEAALVPESGVGQTADGPGASVAEGAPAAPPTEGAAAAPPTEGAPGTPMKSHHRRILATGIGRLRAKIQYRPVVFELLPDEFTLGRLQGTVESLAGQHLHKQNFRRLVEQQELVEASGDMDAGTGGRPARLFRFRREVLAEREAAGTKLPVPRSR